MSRRGLRSISRRWVFNQWLGLSDRRGGRRRWKNCRSRMGRRWVHVRCGSGGWRVLDRPRGGNRADQRGGRRRGCSPDGWRGDWRGKNSGSWRKSRDRCRRACLRSCGGKCCLNLWCLWRGPLRDRAGCCRGLSAGGQKQDCKCQRQYLQLHVDIYTLHAPSRDSLNPRRHSTYCNGPVP